MSGEREAVEARARAFGPKWIKQYPGRPYQWTGGSWSDEAMVKFAADFSLAENAEREKQLVGKNLIDVIGKAWLKLEQRAEAARAEVVKLREALETIRADAHKGAVSMSLDAHEFHELELLAESALNPGAAK